jgi:hypothetical protein
MMWTALEQKITGHGAWTTPWPRRFLLADLGTVLFRKIEVAVGAMKVHARPEHMGIDDKYFLTSWTCHFDGLTHGLPLIHFWIFDFGF